MADDLGEVISRVSRLEIKMANTIRVGAVTDVQSGGGEQKVRVNVGMDPDGQPVKGPWLHTGDHRGAARQEYRYEAGQNVVLIAPGGDYRQALVLPHGESNARPRPDHATDTSESYQYDTVRHSRTADLNETWLAKGSTSHSSNGSGTGSGASGGTSGPPLGTGQPQQIYTDPDNDSVLLIRHGLKQPAQTSQTSQTQAKPQAKPAGNYLVKTTKQAGGSGSQQPQSITHSVNGDHTVGITEGQGISHSTIGNLLHTVQQAWTAAVTGAISHTSSQGDITHSASKGNISISAALGNFARTAKSIIDTAQSIAHSGNTSVTGILGVTQNVTALGFGLISDRRTKASIAPLEADALALVRSLRVCRYTVEGETTVRWGFVADEVRDAAPELGGHDHRGFQTVDVPGLLAALVLAVQQLDQQGRQQHAHSSR